MILSSLLHSAILLWLIGYRCDLDMAFFKLKIIHNLDFSPFNATVPLMLQSP